MKNIVMILIFIFVSVQILFSSDFPFEFERLSYDLNGVISTSNNHLICYGEGSMIMQSTDLGITWTQKRIEDDSLDIIKMFNYHGSIYGAMNYNVVFKSDNEFITTNSKSIISGRIKNIFIDDDVLLVLHDNIITILDSNFNEIKNLKLSQYPNPTELVELNGNIFCVIDSGKILKKSIFDFEELVIDFKKLGICSQCKYPYFLKQVNKILYVQLDAGNVFKSTDEGLTWELSAENVTTIYNVFKEKIYSVEKNVNFPSQLETINFYDYGNNTKGTKISNNLIKRICVLNTIEPKDFTLFNDNFVIMVGANKGIFLSKNGGIDWETISVFNFTKSNGSFWVNNKLGYNYSINGTITRTMDGGITWIPQQFNSIYGLEKLGEFGFMYFDETGLGAIFHTRGEKNAKNMEITYDFGDTFETYNDTILKRNVTPDLFNDDFIIKIKSGYRMLSSRGWIKQRYIRIYDLDENFKYFSESRIDSVLLVYMEKWKDKYLSIWIDKSDTNKLTMDINDTISIFFIAESLDSGLTWNVTDTLKMRYLWPHIYSDDKYFIFTDNLNDTSRVIIIDSTTRILSADWYVNLYDKENKKLIKDIFIDTIYTSIFGFDFDGIKYINCDNPENIIWYNTDFEINPYTWKKLSLKNYDILNIYSYGNKTVKHYKLKNISNKKTYLVRLISRKPTGIINQTEELTKLYLENAYPQPADKYIKLKIYWDNRKEFNESNITVYNIYGQEVGTNGIILNRFNNFSGEIYWDIKDVTTGTYFIEVKHGDTIKTTRIIIVK